MRIQNIKTVGEGLDLLQTNGLRGVSWVLLCTLPLLTIRDLIASQFSTTSESLYPVLALRMILLSMSIGVLLGPKIMPLLARQPQTLAGLFLPLIVLMVDLTIAGTGGGASPVFAGLFTVMVGWAYFIPLPPALSALLFVLVILSYGITVGVLADLSVLGQITIIYQVGLLIIGGIIAWIANNVYRSDQIARFRVLIEQRRLSRLDALTGCANRRALQERGTHACQRAQRFNQYLACLVVDIDDFKAINDAHGHAIGDKTLKHLGEILLEEVAAKGLAARWGGEEFVILLPGQDEDKASSLAEELRRTVEQSPLELPETEIFYTISVGVHSSRGDDCTSMAAMLDPADEALYRAKNEGKNQVFRASQIALREDRITSQLRIRTAAPAEEDFASLASSDFTEKWLKESGYPALIRFAIVLCAITIVLEPLDMLWRYGKGWAPLSVEALYLRALIVLIVGGSALLCFKIPNLRKYAGWLHILLPLFCALSYSLLSYITGAEEGSTFIAVMFLLVVVSFTTPGGLRQGVPLVILITLCWPIAIALTKSIGVEAINPIAMVVRTSIIIVMGIVCVFLQDLFHRIRFEQASVQAHLEHTSTTDRLTGASNRRFFRTRLKEEVASAIADNTPLTLILMDLDHLKTVNDTHGHLAGDTILTQLSQTVRNEIRGIDVFARLGGDEFALVLPGTHAEGAKILAKRIRNCLADASVSLNRKEPIKISASMGIAILEGAREHEEGLGKKLFDRADEAVYFVKQNHRGGIALNSLGETKMI